MVKLLDEKKVKDMSIAELRANIESAKREKDMTIKELQAAIECKKKEIVKMFSEPKEILSVKETMELLSISRRTFFRYRNEGIITTFKLKHKLYCKYSQIMAALDKGIQKVA